MQNSNKKLFISSFILKVIALLTMTFDHIGLMLDESKFGYFRIIGRIAFPLFVFMVVEGVLHTKNFKKYLLRLGIMSIVVAISLIVMPFIDPFMKTIAYESGNIFLDLLLIAIMIKCLSNKDIKIKLISLLPLAYLIFCFIVMRFESCGCRGLYEWLPPCLRTQYGIFGALLGIGFYISKPLGESFYKNFLNKNDIPEEIYEDSIYPQLCKNGFSVLTVFVVTAIYYLIVMLFGDKYVAFIDKYQYYAIISCLFILFYNNNRGYDSKWFRILTYIYYPLHIGLIAIIFVL